jgi:HpcH/HpaI aldolase/citrate lyase family
VIVALQVETADCIKKIDAIADVNGVDMLFLGQNDLCMSMGLYEKYKFPDMYTSPELGDATNKLIAAARRRNIILGVFLFGTARVSEFLGKEFRFISVGNDLHHMLTQAGAYVKDVEEMAKKGSKPWARGPTALFLLLASRFHWCRCRARLQPGPYMTLITRGWRESCCRRCESPGPGSLRSYRGPCTRRTRRRRPPCRCPSPDST